jgi:hypothetical protein
MAGPLETEMASGGSDVQRRRQLVATAEMQHQVIDPLCVYFRELVFGG